MMPITQSSLVSRMHMTSPSRGVSAELAWYVRDEYGANAAFAETAIGRTAGARRTRIPNGAGGLVRRLLATVSEAVVGALASPGGA